MTSDLPSGPHLDAAGNLTFRLGGRLAVTGDTDGNYRGDLPVTWMLTTLRGLGVVAMVEVNAGRMTIEEAGHHLGETCASAFAPVRMEAAQG